MDVNLMFFFSDDVAQRALPVFMGAHADMTNERCVTLCAGYTYAGIEYANECCAFFFKKRKK